MALSHIYINQIGPEEIIMDFSPGVAGITKPDTPYGFAYTKTLEHLGFEVENEPTEWLPRLRVAGSIETAREHLSDLQRHIGVIARYGSQKEIHFSRYNRDSIGRLLGKIVQKTIPDLASDISLPDLSFAIAYPFGSEFTEKGVRGHTGGCKAPWLASKTELAVQKRISELYGRDECIAMNPKIAPKERLEQLKLLLEPKAIFEERLMTERETRVRQATELLRSIGYTIVAPQTTDGATS